MPELTPIKRKQQRKAELWTERASWIPHWKEISQYQQPRAGRFFLTDRNRGEKRHQSIYDRTALGASRTLAAGLMSGMTSPARPWFRVGLSDRDLMDYGPVKTWLHRTGVLLRDIFSASNTYRTLQQGYMELGLFGTWATCVLPDFDNVLHHYPMTVGEYAIATDHKGRVDSLAREWEMTVAQVVRQFGRDAVSTKVRNLYDRGSLDAWVPVVHMVEPNEGREYGKHDAKNMRWSSCYYEVGEDKYLRESGFKRFPILAPRWELTGNDIYGSSPGMEALGDVKSLQHEQLRKAQAIDYQSNPPLQVPTSLKDKASRLPGGVTYYDATQPNGGIRTAFDVNLNLQHLLLDIEDTRSRIRSAYYEDLFLMLANDTRSGTTATEIAERHEEKLLMLGPVLERLHNELLSPMVDIAFDYAAEARILPPIPEELQGVDLNIEFISTLAQAQRVVTASGMDRLIGTIGSMAQLWPEAKHKINALKTVDEYAEGYGVSPEIIVDDETVQQIVAQEAQAQAAQAAAASAPAMADAAKALGETDTGNVRDALSMFQGYQ